MKLSAKKKREIFESLRFFGFLFLLFSLVYGAIHYLGGEKECFLEFPHCPEGLLSYALINGLLVTVIMILSIAFSFLSFVLFFKKPFRTIAFSIGFILIGLALLNLMNDQATHIQEYFRYPVAILNFLVGAYFIKMMLAYSQKDHSQRPPKSNLIQKQGYRLYYKKKSYWKAINWMSALALIFGLNIISLADGVDDWTATLSGLGITTVIAGPLLLIGAIQSRHYMAFTEQGEFEFRIVMGQITRYRKFSAKSVKELQLKWSVFIPEDKKKKDTWHSIRTESQKEIAKLTKSFKTITAFTKKAQYKMKSKAGTEIYLFPFELKFLDESATSKMKWKINLEDNEQIMLLKQLPDSTKITLNPEPNWMLPKSASF